MGKPAHLRFGAFGAVLLFLRPALQGQQAQKATHGDQHAQQNHQSGAAVQKFREVIPPVAQLPLLVLKISSIERVDLVGNVEDGLEVQRLLLEQRLLWPACFIGTKFQNQVQRVPISRQFLAQRRGQSVLLRAEQGIEFPQMLVRGGLDGS